MKHLVQIKVTPDAGHVMDHRPGGPGPVIRRLLERFQPEAVYSSPARRELYLVCDLTAADMAELMLAVTELAGEYPEFTPVFDGEDVPAILAQAVTAAARLVNGGG